MTGGCNFLFDEASLKDVFTGFKITVCVRNDERLTNTGNPTAAFGISIQYDTMNMDARDDLDVFSRRRSDPG